MLDKIIDLTETWLGAIVLIVMFLLALWFTFGYPQYKYRQCLENAKVINKELCKEILK